MDSVKPYKVLVIGCGSIGTRHARILKSIVPCIIFAFRPVLHRSRAHFAEGILSDWGRVQKEKIDFAVIANPSALHMRPALSLAQLGIPFLIEKPVSTSLEHTKKLADAVHSKQIPVLVGFNLRYHILYRKLKHLIASKTLGIPLFFSAETGYFLPYWRNDDYRKSYSAQKLLGGGVIFDLTHELDMAVDLFGPVSAVSCMKGKISNLQIQTEDIAEISLRHKNKRFSHIHVDYLQKKYTRRFKVVCERGEIVWDYAQGCINVFRGKTTGTVAQPADYHRDETFYRQAKHWLSVFRGKEDPECSLAQGIYVSAVAIAAHRSAEQKKWVTVS